MLAYAEASVQTSPDLLPEMWLADNPAGERLCRFGPGDGDIPGLQFPLITNRGPAGDALERFD